MPPPPLPPPLSAKARIPSVTTWTRLEPQPRDATMARALQAQIRDPLWLLARQWQVGEFAGDDAGSPVQATLGIESLALTGYRPGLPGHQPGPAGPGGHQQGQPVGPYDQAWPVEAHVEPGMVRFEVRGSVQLGVAFEELAADASVPTATIDAFRAAFPIELSDPEPHLAGVGGLQLRAMAAGRVVDGEALYWSAQAARDGRPPTPALPPEASDPTVAGVLNAFVALRAASFVEPASEAAWQSSELTYAFATEASSTAGDSVVLEADRFPGGRLDWYSFDTGTGAVASAPQAPEYSTVNALPIHVTFRGMAADRWWGFEDGRTDFGQLDAEHVDLAKLLVMEFALVYGSDWFFVPVASRFGALQRVTTLVVTDTFGARTLIRPAEQYPVQGSPRPWSMFKVADDAGQPGDFLLMAPTVGLTDDADPVEEVVFVRDAMAAMAWGVEKKLHGSLDLAVDASERYLAGLPADAAAAVEPMIAYTLEQPAPDNWIPFVPVLTSSGATALRRGTMDIPGPGGTVVPLKVNAEVLNPGQPYYLTDRVVTPIGADVQQYLRRTRLTDGTTVVWMARRSGPGTGPGASGLKFDFLRDGGSPT